MDTYERLIINDLRHNAILSASFAWFAAQRDVKIPGKPAMKAPQGGQGQRPMGF
jgi:hypothetical protein